MKKKLFISLLAVCLIIGLSMNISAEVLTGGDLVEMFAEELEREMGAMELQMNLDMGEEYLILDVRSTEERNEGFIPGSDHIDFGIMFFRIGNFVEDPEEEFIVACQSGARSTIAAKLLQDMGYKPINLAGGFLGWEDAGYEVEMP